MLRICRICYFLVVVFVCFPSLGFVDVRLSVNYVFVGVVSFLGLGFSFLHFL